MKMTSRAWLEISESALISNYRKVKNFIGEAEIMAIAKAEAYGHGAASFAATLEKAGCNAFAVASPIEGIELRKSGINGMIFVLGWSDPELAPELVKYDITVAAVCYEHAKAMSETGYPVKMQVAIDTGMKRLGESYDSPLLIEEYYLPNIKITGTFSHLAMADSDVPEDRAFTEMQIKRFDETVAMLKKRRIAVGKLHLQASYGIVNYPEKHYDYVRPGLLLFGIKSLSSDKVVNDLGLIPALSLKARVASVKTVEKGETAGYNRHFVADRKTKIADITVGYCDCLPRCYFNCGGTVLIGGKEAKIVDLCMDQLLADVTGIDVKTGDTVTVTGKDGGKEIRVEEIAEKCGTISNEIVSRIHGRVERVYVK